MYTKTTIVYGLVLMVVIAAGILFIADGRRADMQTAIEPAKVDALLRKAEKQGRIRVAVTVRDDISGAREKAITIASDDQAEPSAIKGTPIIIASLTPNGLKRLLASGTIRSVEEDVILRLH